MNQNVNTVKSRDRVYDSDSSGSMTINQQEERSRQHFATAFQKLILLSKSLQKQRKTQPDRLWNHHMPLTPSTPKLHAAPEPSSAAPPWAFGSVGDAADAELASDAALEGAGPAAGPAAVGATKPHAELGG